MKKDAVEFLRGEADTLELFANDKDAFDIYVEGNGLDESEDYEEGGYDLSNYNENTWAHIADQVDHRHGYDKQFADRIMDLIDAYYSGGSAYVENDIEAESRLLAEALNYVADKLEVGEITVDAMSTVLSLKDMAEHLIKILVDNVQPDPEVLSEAIWDLFMPVPFPSIEEVEEPEEPDS